MRIGQTALRCWLTQYGARQSGQTGIGKALTAVQHRIWQLALKNQPLGRT
jgi:transposase